MLNKSRRKFLRAFFAALILIAFISLVIDFNRSSSDRSVIRDLGQSLRSVHITNHPFASNLNRISGGYLGFHVERIGLGSETTSKHIELLKDLPSLESISFSVETNIDNRTIATLREIPTIKDLSLLGCKLDASVFQELQRFSELEYLRIAVRPPHTVVPVSVIDGMSSLQVLHVLFGKVHLIDLKDIKNPERFTGLGFHGSVLEGELGILNRFKGLRYLSLSETNIMEEDLIKLKFPQLKILYLTELLISEECIQILDSSFGNAEIWYSSPKKEFPHRLISNQGKVINEAISIPNF